MKITLNLKHYSTLIHFYNWVSEWRDRLPLSTEHKSNQTVGKKLEQKHHDESS